MAACPGCVLDILHPTGLEAGIPEEAAHSAAVACSAGMATVGV